MCQTEYMANKFGRVQVSYPIVKREKEVESDRRENKNEFHFVKSIFAN
jgi:hypothetical protein